MASGVRDKFRKVLRDGDLSEGLPILEWAFYWDLTVQRWVNEGLPAGMGTTAVWDYFGLEAFAMFWQCPRAPECPVAPAHGAGILHNEREYDALLPLLYPEFDIRKTFLFKQDLREWERRFDDGSAFVWFTIDGPFWHPRELLGIECHLFAFYEQPDLMKRIVRDHAEFTVRIVEAMCRYRTPDILVFAEDMSYNHGPMISRDLFQEFIAPYYHRVTRVLREKGIVPFIDSDGMIEPAIAWFEEAGLEGILPLERMAGVDVNRIRRGHPEWKMIGGFDKTVMARGEDALRAEFDRLRPAVLSGRYIPSVDHQTPPHVSLEDYRLYVRLLREFSESVAAEFRAAQKPRATP